MKTKQIVGSTIIAAGIIAGGAIAIAQSNANAERAIETTSAAEATPAATDDLDSATNGDGALANLKEVERAWLHQMIAEGKIRLATQADKDAWLVVAQSKKPGEKLLLLDAGRTFVILDNIDIPPTFPNGERMTGNITFIVAPNTPFPKTRAGTPIYDIDSGGWYQLGSYFDGEKEGVGYWPHSQPTDSR